MSHSGPFLVDPRIIVDPYDPVNSLVVLATGLILCLACLGLIYLSEVKNMSDKQVGSYFTWASNIAVFVALLSLLAIYYPAVDFWWYTNTNLPFYYGLANPWNYGRLHMPSVIFTFAGVLAAVISPLVTALLVKGFEKVVTQVRGQAAGDVAKP